MVKQKKPTKKAPNVNSRYINPPKKKAPGIRTPVDKRRAGEYYNPTFQDDLNNSLEDMSDYIHGRDENEV